MRIARRVSAARVTQAIGRVPHASITPCCPWHRNADRGRRRARSTGMPNKRVSGRRPADMPTPMQWCSHRRRFGPATSLKTERIRRLRHIGHPMPVMFLATAASPSILARGAAPMVEAAVFSRRSGSKPRPVAVDYRWPAYAQKAGRRAHDTDHPHRLMQRTRAGSAAKRHTVDEARARGRYARRLWPWAVGRSYARMGMEGRFKRRPAVSRLLMEWPPVHPRA